MTAFTREMHIRSAILCLKAALDSLVAAETPAPEEAAGTTTDPLSPERLSALREWAGKSPDMAFGPKYQVLAKTILALLGERVSTRFSQYDLTMAKHGPGGINDTARQLRSTQAERLAADGADKVRAQVSQIMDKHGFRVRDTFARHAPSPMLTASTVSWDTEADCMYVCLRPDESVAQTVAFGPGRNVDLNEFGYVVGVEFLDYSDGVDLRELPCASRIAKILKEPSSLSLRITE